MNQNLKRNRDIWEAAKGPGRMATLKVLLHSKASDMRSKVIVKCPRKEDANGRMSIVRQDPCKVNLMNRKGRMAGISLGTFLMGGELDSDGFYPDDVLCLKVANSAGCLMNEQVVFQSLTSIVVQEHTSLLLVDGKVKLGQLPGLDKDVEVLIVRHWKNGNFKKSQPLANPGSDGEFVRLAWSEGVSCVARLHRGTPCLLCSCAFRTPSSSLCRSHLCVFLWLSRLNRVRSWCCFSGSRSAAGRHADRVVRQ